MLTKHREGGQKLFAKYDLFHSDRVELLCQDIYSFTLADHGGPKNSLIYTLIFCPYEANGVNFSENWSPLGDDSNG